jgi:hypothetical protein
VGEAVRLTVSCTPGTLRMPFAFAVALAVSSSRVKFLERCMWLRVQG